MSYKNSIEEVFLHKAIQYRVPRLENIMVILLSSLCYSAQSALPIGKFLYFLTDRRFLFFSKNLSVSQSQVS